MCSYAHSITLTDNNLMFHAAVVTKDCFQKKTLTLHMNTLLHVKRLLRFKTKRITIDWDLTFEHVPCSTQHSQHKSRDIVPKPRSKYVSMYICVH